MVNRKRIEKLFPSVYITLISILLGFAVEDLIGSLRELAPLDIYTSLTAVGILTGVFAAWTGYSFVSMTQERLPKILDGANVFYFALGIYLMISTMGMEKWYLFATISIYLCGALIGCIYNFNLLLTTVSSSYDLRVFRWDLSVIATGILVYPGASWMSMRGMLSSGVELFLIAYFTIINILWVYFFYKAWSKIVDEKA